MFYARVCQGTVRNHKLSKLALLMFVRDAQQEREEAGVPASLFAQFVVSQ